MSINVQKPRPHDTLVRDIRRQIETGELSVDHLLLPENELARKYDVSSRAVRAGLASLEAEGLIRRHRGRGTTVLPIEAKKPAGLKLQKNVAVIFQGRVSDPNTAEVFDSLQQSFQNSGYGTTLYVADGDPMKETRLVEQLTAEGVPGMVLYTTHPVGDDAHLRAAQQTGTKVLLIDHDLPEAKCNFVGIDDRLAAFEITEHLIRLGCKDLLLISDERNWTTLTLGQQGFEEAGAKYGVRQRIVRLPRQPIPHRDRQLKEVLTTGLEGLHKPLGIVVWVDAVAVLAMQYLKELGWTVPGDARVVGIGNEKIGAEAEVPLTTMAIPRREISRLAASLLVDQMRFPDQAVQHIRLPARLIIRKSCGTYPHG